MESPPYTLSKRAHSATLPRLRVLIKPAAIMILGEVIPTTPFTFVRPKIGHVWIGHTASGGFIGCLLGAVPRLLLTRCYLGFDRHKEGMRFELMVPLRTPVFKTGAIGLSANLPKRPCCSRLVELHEDRTFVTGLSPAAFQGLKWGGEEDLNLRPAAIDRRSKH
jgi:hypothetical protein